MIEKNMKIIIEIFAKVSHLVKAKAFVQLEKNSNKKK